MRLDKYYRALNMLSEGASVDDVQEATKLQSEEVLRLASGARLPEMVLFHVKGKYERCPKCGRNALLPCIICTLKDNPGLGSMDVIKRPERNQKDPADIALDYQLTEEG